MRIVRIFLTLAVMGCVVGVRGNEALRKAFPYVDVFMEPSTDGAPLMAHLGQSGSQLVELEMTARRHAWQDEEVIVEEPQQDVEPQA